ncbi:MAG: M50 family metallopeptidase [Planctomycetes bacterium]|nr:M50 family metallopeptidase [Planctomycetota bacterium]
MTQEPGHWTRKPVFWVTLSFVIALFAWDTRVLYPLKLLVVFMHESGHAIATWLTGGSVLGIEIDAHERGVTTTLGGWRLVTLSGGYLGSTVIGALLLRAAWSREIGRYVLRGLAVLLGLAILIAVRDFFTILFCALTGLALFLAGWKASPPVQRAIGTFLGVTSCLYAVIDIKDDVLTAGGRLTFMGGANKSDAQQLAELTWIPAFVWGLAWIAISLFVIYRVLRTLTTSPASRL